MAQWIVTSNKAGTVAAGSLGLAMKNAASGDSIIFALEGATGNTINCTGLNVTKNLDIDGNNTAGDNVVINGRTNKQLFIMSSGKSVSFSGMTMALGKSTSADTAGGITNKGGTVSLTDVLFIGNTYHYSVQQIKKKGAGALLNSAGVVTLANVEFTDARSTMAYAANIHAGAICNYNGTVNVAGSVSLDTKYDTWVNVGDSNAQMAVVNWDLTGGTASYGSIDGFQWYSNNGNYVKQIITVSATQEEGQYVIASGDLSNLATNVKSFTITGVSGKTDAKISVDGSAATYNDLTYSIANVNNEQLVLTVAGSKISIADATVTVTGEYTYNGAAQKASVTVVLESTTLEKDTDYTLTYQNNVNAGTATVTVTGIGKYTDATNANFTISTKELTVTGTAADGKTYDGNTTAQVGDLGVLIGKVDGDDVEIGSATAAFADKNAGNGKDVTVSYTLTGEKAANYTVADSQTTADIEKRSVTLTSATDSKKYDGTPLTNDTVTASGDGWVDGEGATCDVTGTQTEIGSSDNTFTYNLNDGTLETNYTITKEEGTLTVTPWNERITVTEDNSPYALVTGGTYTCPAYAFEGGALYVEADCIVTGVDVTFTGNTAFQYGGAIVNNGTISFTSATFSGNTAGEGGGAISNDGGTITFSGSSVTFSGNTAMGEEGFGGAIYNYGTIDFGTGSVVFSGNTAVCGGAIDNYDATISFAGTIDLATASDIWLNETNEGTSKVNWDITGGTAAYATIKNFERYSNADGADVKQTITVTATQELGDYVIATGDLADLTNKDTFYLTIDGTTLSDAIKVNTLGYFYNDRYYSLTQTDSALTLTVADHYDVTSSKSLGGIDTVLAGGTYNRMVLGGELQSGDHDYNGSYTLTVTGGTFVSDFAGGDASNGDVERTGNITLNISGGTFNRVTAGSYYAGEKDLNKGATLIGDINLNISGGTFSGRVYGGCGAMTDKLGSEAEMQGDVNLTIAATNAISFGECIAAGNRGHGDLYGNVNVTVTGLGGNLIFAGDSVLFGGCSGDCYRYESGVRYADTAVSGTRELTFDSFEGPFGAEIRMFSDISFVNNTSVDFADDALDLKEVGVWNFDCSSCVTNLNKNKFAGDTINIDTSNYDGEWTLIQGSEEALADLGSASLVTLGGVAATWDKDTSAWCTAEYQLWVEEEEQLMISKLA